MREGALPLSGDAGIDDVRREIEAGLGEARAAGRSRRSTSGTNTTPTPSPSSTPNVKPMKVVVDGGNGMAGPMVGPILEQMRSSWR